MGTEPRDRRMFYATILTAGIGFGIVAPYVALTVTEVGGSPTAAAVTVASMGISLLVVDLLAAQWLVGGGTRVILTASTLTFASGSLLSAFASMWELVAVGRVVQGVGAAMFMSGGASLAMRLVRSDSADGRSMIRVFNAVWFAGIALGPLIGGGVIAADPGLPGLRLLFVISVVACTVAGMAGWFLVPRVDPTPARVFGPPRALYGKRIPGRSVLVLAAAGQVVRAAIAMTLIPLICGAQQMDSVSIAVTLFALAVTDTASMFLAPKIIRESWHPFVLAAALVWGAGVCTALAFWSTGPLQVVALALAMGFAVGVSWIMPALIAVEVIRPTADALSLYRIASDIGLLVGGALTALALATVGLRPTLLAAGIAMVLLAVVAAHLGRRMRTQGIVVGDPPRHKRGHVHALPID
ncbi:MFS transporter [uncultured Gordonia sp.]|uniref:MFS transporter n=1 Tax=uncultured Gordonia sp. TaxID=198437 RepID=UPI00258C99F7|nr:MFS transporter [uncultured Gordonia sp.]